MCQPAIQHAPTENTRTLLTRLAAFVIQIALFVMDKIRTSVLDARMDSIWTELAAQILALQVSIQTAQEISAHFATLNVAFVQEAPKMNAKGAVVVFF
jgi:hypothetical protein